VSSSFHLFHLYRDRIIVQKNHHSPSILLQEVLTELKLLLAIISASTGVEVH